MYLTKKLYKNSFKDYFSTPKNSAFEMKNVSYRKTSVTEQSLGKEKDSEQLVSFERVKASRILYVIDLILYHLSMHQSGKKVLTDEKLLWFRHNERRLREYINNADEQTSFYTPHYMYQHKSYSTKGYLSEEMSDLLSYEKKVGRLWGKKSIQGLPRELRFLLFQEGEYRDFDIKNAHPSILLDYAESEGIELSGTLLKYVNFRDEFLVEVRGELPAKTLARLEKDGSSVKNLIIIHMNRIWEKSGTGSETLDAIDSEFGKIRDYMWDSYKNGFMQEYLIPLEGKKIDDLTKRKTRLTSLYCQTQESRHLFWIIDKIREKYSALLKAKNKKYFNEFEPLTDKMVKLGSDKTLLTIPFFDGFYIKCLDKDFEEDIAAVIEECNVELSKISHVRFVEKELLPDFKYLDLDRKNANFVHVYNWLANPANRSKVGRYIEKNPAINKYVSELSDILRDDPEILAKITIVNNKLKASFYESLIDGNREYSNEKCVNEEVTNWLKNTGEKETLP